ncbi:hypothetical protein CR513_44215, partial [Mucuna pruriens]
MNKYLASFVPIKNESRLLSYNSNLELDHRRVTKEVLRLKEGLLLIIYIFLLEEKYNGKVQSQSSLHTLLRLDLCIFQCHNFSKLVVKHYFKT